MKPPRNILVIVTRRIGDVLMATPLIHSLRAAWPDAAIDVAVYRGTETCLTANPHITSILPVDEQSPWTRQIAFIRSIRGKYDVALSTLPGDRPTFYACLAGKKSFGLVEREFKQIWKRLLLSGWKEFDNRNTHTVLMNLALTDMLHIEKLQDMVISWNKSQEDRLSRLLPFHRKHTPYAVLHLFPQFTYKMWRTEAWGELARNLSKQGYRIILTGSNAPKEKQYIESLLPLFPRDSTDMSGRLHINEVACLIADAALYVGPDTSVTHLAAALGTPTVALYGPTNPVKWGPWPRNWQSTENPYQRKGTPQRANNVVLLQGNRECVPCAEEGCERSIHSESRCLHSITVDDVLSAAEILIPRS